MQQTHGQRAALLLLLLLLRQRFQDAVTPHIEQRVAAAPRALLDIWISRVLSTNTLAEFAGRLIGSETAWRGSYSLFGIGKLVMEFEPRHAALWRLETNSCVVNLAVMGVPRSACTIS